MSQKEYTASSIQALEGMEHVRMRPSMYIGDVGIRGLHHLVYEVVDSFVVEPEDILNMTIEKDQDLLSLVTCTPYGINTKRLVVKAKRIFPKKKNQPRKSYSMREFLFLIIPVVFLIVFKVVRR